LLEVDEGKKEGDKEGNRKGSSKQDRKHQLSEKGRVTVSGTKNIKMTV